MPNSSKQDVAVKMANDLIQLASRAKALYDDVLAFNGRNGSNSPDTTWRLMATNAVNPDGSIGAADATPNLTHPITVAALNRAEGDLLQGLTFALEFAQFVNGTLPTARAAVDRRAPLDTLIG